MIVGDFNRLIAESPSSDDTVSFHPKMMQDRKCTYNFMMSVFIAFAVLGTRNYNYKD